MPFVNSFTAEQLYSSPTTLRITDTSTGSDSNINARRVYLRQANGEYLVPTGTTTNYIEWAIGTNYIDIDVLNVDYSLEIKVEWIMNTTQRITENNITRITENGDIRITQ